MKYWNRQGLQFATAITMSSIYNFLPAGNLLEEFAEKQMTLAIAFLAHNWKAWFQEL